MEAKYQDSIVFITEESWGDKDHDYTKFTESLPYRVKKKIIYQIILYKNWTIFCCEKKKSLCPLKEIILIIY